MDSGQSKMIGDGGTENTNIANAIKKKLQISPPHSRISGGCSIHRVPQKFHKMRDPSAYMPQVVSIGPYHRTDQSLKSREDLKLLYAHKLLAKRAEEGDSEYARIVQEEEDTCAIKLNLSGTLVATEAWLEESISSIKNMETGIRRCYSEPVNLNSAEFVEMMIIDGLFLIGILMRLDLRRSYIADDPFDGNDWLLFMVEQDMLLLENQIPLFVLRCLFSIIFSVEDQSRINSLNKYILDFITKMWQRMSPPDETIPCEAHPDQCEQAEHLLDCLVILIKPPAYTRCKSSSSSWKPVEILKKLKDNMVVKFTITQYSSVKLFIQTQITKPERTRLPDEESVNVSDKSCYYFIPSATELRRAGVRFIKASTQGRSILDIRSNSTGILEIPPVLISDDTDPLLRNLIACEQLYGRSYYMSSYVNLMDFLINSADDVKLLRRKGIISNYLGCDEDVSNMFNKLCIGIVPYGDHYSIQMVDINKFYKKRRHIWQATLKREYFSNPWAIISVFAAALLIALTMVSTVFGILSVSIPKS